MSDEDEEEVVGTYARVQLQNTDPYLNAVFASLFWIMFVYIPADRARLLLFLPSPSFWFRLYLGGAGDRQGVGALARLETFGRRRSRWFHICAVSNR